MIIHVVFEETDQQFTAEFHEVDSAFPADFGEMQVVTDYTGALYEGDYVVTPQAEGQVLKTAQKLMRDDVTIEAIPFFEVSNNSGGTTVYIGTLNYPSKKAVLGKAKLGIMKL
jgi:hypothetical protein